jgi:hypothetical protein
VQHAVVGEAISVYGERDGHSPRILPPGELPKTDVLEVDCEGAEIGILRNMTIRPPPIAGETPWRLRLRGGLCAGDCLLPDLLSLLDRSGFRASRRSCGANSLFLGAWIGLSYLALSGQTFTGKLHMIKILPFFAILWALTSTLGVNGVAIARRLRVRRRLGSFLDVRNASTVDIVPALRPLRFSRPAKPPISSALIWGRALGCLPCRREWLLPT